MENDILKQAAATIMRSRPNLMKQHSKLRFPLLFMPIEMSMAVAKSRKGLRNKDFKSRADAFAIL